MKPEKLGLGFAGVWGFMFNDNVINQDFQDPRLYDSRQAHSFPPSSLDRRCFMLIVSPKTVVGCRGGNLYVEGDLFTFGYLILDDALGYPYYWLFNIG